MGQTNVPELPRQRPRLEAAIQKTELSRPLREAVLSALYAMRDGVALCHGDFHPGNVLLSQNGPVIIDWEGASSGAPLSDAARTLLLFELVSAIPEQFFSGARSLTGFAVDDLKNILSAFSMAYKDRYTYGHSEYDADLRRWRPIMAAVRLSENVPGEQVLLRRIIAAKFGNPA